MRGDARRENRKPLGPFAPQRRRQIRHRLKIARALLENPFPRLPRAKDGQTAIAAVVFPRGFRLI